MGAPYEMNGPYQTGDVYKCSLSKRINGNGCSKLNLGIVSQNTTQLLHTVTVTILIVQHLDICVYTCLYACVLVCMCLSKHHGGMCETEMWLQYQSLHILLFFNGLCLFPYVSYTTHLACFFTYNICVVLVRWAMKFCQINI